MTITANLSTVTLNGNGVATSFPFNFWVPDASALQCWITDSAGLLSQTTDFTVALTESGGTVAYPASGGAALPAGAKITIMRNMPFTQQTDFVNATSFHAEVVEDALDNLTAQAQQIAEAVGRAVKVPISSTVDPENLIAKLETDAITASTSAQTATTQAQAAAQSATDAAASAVAVWTTTASVDAGGTANALTATLATAPQTALADRMRVRVRAIAANSGAATLDLTLNTVETGALPIRKAALAALEAGDIAGAGHELDLQYNATAAVWLLLNPAVTGGNAADQYLRMDSTGKIPAGTDGSQLINLPTLPAQSASNAGASLITDGSDALWGSSLKSGSPVATSGNTSIDREGLIPTWAHMVVVTFNGVSTNGTSPVQVQLGTSAGIETSGYTALGTGYGAGVTSAVYSTGFALGETSKAAYAHSGFLMLFKAEPNVWVGYGCVTRAGDTSGAMVTGAKALAGALDRVRLTTINGTDIFDAGYCNVLAL